jgi:hypothetical protein
MRLIDFTSSTWIIAAVVEDRGRCSIREALDAVAVTDRAAHAQLLALLGRISLAGPPRDERRSRRLIVCSELCRKPKPRELRGIVRHAQRLRAAYLAASAAGDILVERGA